MILPPDTVSKIRAEAVSGYPLETVWLVTDDGCQQVHNLSESPEITFAVSQKDLAGALARNLRAVVHSHPDGFAAPSGEDMSVQLALGVPWGVLSTDGVSASEIAWWGKGVEPPPLIGRPFRHGITDCYSLVRDYYSMELGIELPEFPRNWLWWETGRSMLLDGFRTAGFQEVPEDQVGPGDLWFAQINSPTPNHVGVLLEGDLMLHQVGARKQVDLTKRSARAPISRYRHLITHWLRHNDR